MPPVRDPLRDHGKEIDKRCIKKTLGETARPDGSYSHFALQNGGPELVVNPLEAVQLFFVSAMCDSH